MVDHHNSEDAVRRATIEEWLGNRTARALTREPGTGIPLVTLGQRGLLFQAGLKGPMNTGSGFIYELDSPLDPDALEQAARLVVARHEPLRTRYLEQTHDIRMLVDSLGPQIRIVETCAAEGLDEIKNWLTRPFDLTSEWPLRIRLYATPYGTGFLAVVVHHVAFDGWSLGVFERELSTAYTSIEAKTAWTVAPLTLSFSECAAGQRRQLDHSDHAALDYWRGALADAPPHLPLPLDGPRPEVQSYAGSSSPIQLDEQLIARVQELGDRCGATVPVVILAGFAAFLGKWCRVDDLVIGVPSANRMSDAEEQLIGFFMNLLPIRFRMRPGHSFTDLVKQTRATVLGALDHQSVPFDTIVELDEIRRPAARASGWRTPLVNFAVAMQTAPRGTCSLGSTNLSPVESHEQSSLFDMTVSVGPREGGYAGHLEFNTELFDRLTVAQFISTHLDFLSRLLQAPDEALERVPLATAAACPPAPAAKLADGWTIERLIESVRRLATTDPSRVAVAETGHEITYGELWRSAQSAAASIRDAGTAAGECVGVWTERGWVAAAGLLGTLIEGVGYVPLSPDLPRHRVREMVGRVGARLVLTGPDAVREASALRLTATVEPIRPGLAVAPPSAEPPSLATAYVIFTSGSTGTPKPTAVSRRGLEHLLAVVAGLPCENIERFGLLASVNFDASIWEMLVALVRGGRLDVLHPETVLEELTLLGTECLTATPSLLATLDSPPRSLRVVVSAGERLDRRLGSRLSATARVINAYGPSETAVCATRTTPGGDFSTIGQAAGCTTISLVDELLRPVPQGAVGEVLIGGPGVGLGYLQMPGLTASRFVADPDGTGTTAFRSGDLGYVDAQGNLCFLGRSDAQVKVNGVRIELEELDTVARSVDGVADAASFVDKREGGALLGLAVVPASDADAGDVRAEIDRTLGERLPRSMRPSTVLLVDGLPRTINSKLDRDALAQLARSRPDLDGTVAGASSETEMRCTKIWTEILGPGATNVTRTIYDLGGQSLQATRIVTAIRRTWGVRISMRDFLREPTIRAVALEIDKRLTEQRGANHA